MSGGRPIPCPDDECASDWGYLEDFWPVEDLGMHSGDPPDFAEDLPDEALVGYCARCDEPGIVMPPKTVEEAFS